jgi:hypothetical protein
MYRSMTDAIAYDHIAEMQREAATLRVASDGTGRDGAVSWIARRLAAFRAAATAPSIRRRVARLNAAETTAMPHVPDGDHRFS